MDGAVQPPRGKASIEKEPHRALDLVYFASGRSTEAKNLGPEAPGASVGVQAKISTLEVWRATRLL